MANINPALLLEGETPRLIDEWQITPKLWDAVRFEVDKRDKFSQFILTGSAVPPDLTEIFHIGTGRISRMQMRLMSLFESGDSNGSVSIGELFSGNIEISGKTDISIEKRAFLICRGGWPKSIGIDEDIALMQATDYFDAVVNADISRVDGVERDSTKAIRLLKSYARHVGSQAKLTALIADMQTNEGETITIPTMNSYIKALNKIFVLEDSSAWNPNLRSKTAIRSSDTRYFSDQSIAIAAMGIGPADLINDLKSMGFYFENMCIRDLRVYSESLDGKVYHYRDKNGLECDAIVHLKNGKYGLIEIKLDGDKLIEEGVKTLTRLEIIIDIKKMKKP